jgi:hypothetical protein
VNGKIKFYPANACEMYWSCTNSADYISGLTADIQQLLALRSDLTTPALIAEWTNCLDSLPPLPMDPTGSYVKPAQTYGAPHNAENPECYCIFPYRLYGLGLTNFNIALATFNNRTVQNYKYDWSQDVIEEPLVGLTSAAQTDVINNFSDTDSQCRFQAFWTSRSDYIPCEDTGGAAMSGLQYMLLQCVGNQIRLLPAWPATWSVDFKLNAPGNTSVRLALANGAVSQLVVTPASRTNDLVKPLPAAPAGVTAQGGNQQAALFWNPVTGASSYTVKRSATDGGPYTNLAVSLPGHSFVDTGLGNGSNYYYVVTALNLWGQSTNSIQVSVAPGANFAVHFRGDLIANLQSQDLTAGSQVWSNRTSNSQAVGNFSSINGNHLNLVSVPYGNENLTALYVNGIGGNSVQSSALTPAEINSNNPVSVEVWVKATSAAQTSTVLNYGNQGGSAAPMQDRGFDYDNSGHGAFSGNFGTADTAWNTVPDTNAWHYLAYTYDGTTLRAYLDGNLDITSSGFVLQTAPTLMQVGSDINGASTSNGGNDPFKGYIACARVESGVLSAADISANFAVGPFGTATAVPPTGLTAVAGDGQAVLSWNASANSTGYYLKRSAGISQPYTVIAANLTGLSFTNTGLADGAPCYFVVSATNSAGESANSAAVLVQPVSLTPALISYRLHQGQIQFTWAADHQGWKLQVQTDSATAGLGTNWVTVPGSNFTNQMSVFLSPTNGSVFFRLVYP